MKKKREKCNSYENCQLIIPIEFNFNDDVIQALVNKLKNTDTFEIQQQAITEVSLLLAGV